MTTLPQCLGSLLPTLDQDDEVILVDNASTDGTRAHLCALEGRDSRLRMLYNERNRGFSAGCNLGLYAASHEYLVLLNPDTVLRPGWLEGLQAHFSSRDIGAVGPVSNYVAGVQFLGFHVPDSLLSTLSFAQLPAFLHAQYPHEALETKLLIGFCLMVRRSVLDRAGYLDEALFLGSDDLELSWRLRLQGYRLLAARDVFVEHTGHASFQALPSKTKERLLAESTRALARKLEMHYGPGNIPTSRELFGCDIFQMPSGGKISQQSKRPAHSPRFDLTAEREGLERLAILHPFPATEPEPSSQRDCKLPQSVAQALAQHLTEAARLVVVLGAGEGGATCSIAEHAPNAQVIAIEPVEEARQQPSARKERPYRSFLAHCANYRHRVLPVRLEPLRGLTLISHLRLRPDLVYITNSHDYEMTRHCLLLALRLFPDAHFVGDGWQCEGIRRAVTQVQFIWEMEQRFGQNQQAWWLSRRTRSGSPLRKEKGGLR